MGTYYHYFVFEKISKENVSKTAEIVIQYLIERKIVLPQKSQCLLGDELGYPPGENYKDVLEYTNDGLSTLRSNGVEIRSGHQIFMNNQLENIYCPI